MTQPTYEREIHWIKGYDHRNDEDPDKRRYGQHAPTIVFKVKSGKGAVTLEVSTGWGINDLISGSRPLQPYCHITWHIILHRDPTKNTWSITEGCGWLGDRPCQGSISGLDGTEWLKRLCLEPLEETWKFLEQTLEEKIKEAGV